MARRRRGPPSRPLAGVSRLDPGDVRILMRASFWPSTGVPGMSDWAKAMASKCGVRALAGLSATCIADMKCGDALPDGRRSVVIRPRNVEAEIPITPALEVILRDCKRNRTADEKLFPGQTPRAIINAVNSAGAALGLIVPLWDALKKFHDDGLDAHPNDEDIARYQARTEGRTANADVATAAAVKRMVNARDPFSGERLSQDGDDEALAKARKAGSKLPACLADSFTRSPPPGSDHPLMRDVAAATMTPNVREDIYARYRLELERMAADGSLPIPAQASLFGIGKSAYKKLRRKVRALAGLPPTPATHPGRAPSLRATTGKEAARLARIRDANWPSAAERDSFRLRLLTKHGPFVFDLIGAGKLLARDGAALFRIGRSKFTRVRLDYENGNDNWLVAPPQSVQERTRDHDTLLREAEDRSDGENDEEFVRGVRARFGLRTPIATLISWLRDPCRLPAGHHNAATPDERARLVAIRATTWPRWPKLDAFRISLFEEHGPFVCRLIEDGKLNGRDGAAMFKVGVERLSRMRAAFEAGALRDMAGSPTTHAETRARRQLVLEELARRPDSQSWTEFAAAFEAKYRTELSPQAAGSIARKACPHRKDMFPVAAPSRVPRAGERSRLRTIAAAPWSSCEDIGELRRRLIRDDGPFLMQLWDEGKLSGDKVGRLLRVDVDTASRIRADFRNGTIEHLIGPPAQRRHRAAWLKVLRADGSLPQEGEGQLDCVRRLRREHRLAASDIALTRELRRLRS